MLGYVTTIFLHNPILHSATITFTDIIDNKTHRKTNTRTGNRDAKLYPCWKPIILLITNIHYSKQIPLPRPY